MELITLFTYLGLYTKVYDSKEKDVDNDQIDLLFMDRLPKDNINDRLPLSVLFKMYNDVNFNNKTNTKYYIQTSKFLNKLDDDQKGYIIYIDNWGCFRRIIISSMNKIVLVKDMYF